MKIVGLLFIWLLLMQGCSSPKNLDSGIPAAKPQIFSLKLLDEYTIPHKFLFANTQVGGLSGIDYNKADNKYYLISDDRSNINPARFYVVDIKIKNSAIDTVLFMSSHNLLSPAGNLFPSHREYPGLSPDPESIRFNSKTNTLLWTSEGERQNKKGTEILQQPFIYEMDLNGKFLDSFLIPENLQMQAGNNGPRRNSVFEGSSFARNNELVFVSCEEPLLQDGEAARVNLSGALTRMTKFDTKTRKAIAQFAYPLDAIAHSPKPANAFAVNGISEIIALDEQQLLVMERSFSTGRLINTIKIYLADISNASNIINKPSLPGSKRSFKPITKRILLNSDDLNRYIDNVEGICFGPTLPNGNQSVILIVDDNFNPLQKTQVFLFELVP